jgi:hypothetical protein
MSSNHLDIYLIELTRSNQLTSFIIDYDLLLVAKCMRGNDLCIRYIFPSKSYIYTTKRLEICMY